jgi:hypothetical protein
VLCLYRATGKCNCSVYVRGRVGNWAATKPRKKDSAEQSAACVRGQKRAQDTDQQIVVLPKLRLEFQVTGSTAVRAAACHVDLINGATGTTVNSGLGPCRS